MELTDEKKKEIYNAIQRYKNPDDREPEEIINDDPYLGDENKYLEDMIKHLQNTYKHQFSF